MSLLTNSRSVTWSVVDSGFHVASRAGEFIGSVDVTADGSFIAADSRATPIGRYARLRDAKHAVTDVLRRDEPGLAAKVGRAAQPMATASGALAGVLLVGAASLIPPG